MEPDRTGAATELPPGRAASASRPLRYVECPWGDSITGTKAQLQSLGIGLALAFPGELGGPARRLKTFDPRGFPVTIEHHGDDQYWAGVHFPDWPQAPVLAQCTTLPTGLRLTRCIGVDEYLGAPEALAAAGLVCLDQLPGMPGMRKTRVTIIPDGTALGGAPTANDDRSQRPGTRIIERVSKSVFRVIVRVSAEEEHRRGAACKAAREQWEHQVSLLARPPRLAPATLRLVRVTSAAAAHPPAAHPSRPRPQLRLVL